MITRRRILATAFAVPFVALPAYAGRAGGIYAPDGLALAGIDPVGYFLHGRPVSGVPQNALHWRGAVWLFETAQSRAIFEGDPHAFAPRYGGYCALSMAQGQMSSSDPDAWAIFQDKLYLTHSRAAQTRWSENRDRFVEMADGYWAQAQFAAG